MQNVLAVVGAILIGLSALGGLTVPMDADVLGNFWFQDTYRTIFFHLPLAWSGTLFLLIAALHSARYLIVRQPAADRAAHGSVEIGLLLLVLATVTGMIFAHPQWGSAWNWDPRETSILFVILMYAAYLMLRGALPPDEGLRARVSAAYLLLAVAPMYWLVRIYPKIAAGTLHPTRGPLHAEHYRIIFLGFAGWLCLALWFATLQARAGNISVETESEAP